MQKPFIAKILFLVVVLIGITTTQAQQPEESPESQALTEYENTEQTSKIKEYIDHHLLDSYDFTFFSDEEAGKYYGFPLPVIIFDDGLKVFSSSKFNHGKTVAEVDGKYYKLYHSKIYETNAAGDINYDEEGHATNDKPLDFSITKNVVTMLLVSVLMFFLFRALATSYKKNKGIPTGIGRFLEPLVLFVRDEIAIPNIGKKKYKKYMSFLLTVFFFIWFLNLLGMTPLGVNVTGNIAITFGLALVTFLITHFTANKNYWAHIFWMPGVPKLMRIVLAPIELLGVFIKPFSLMIRLYANMTAGHVVLMSIIALMFIFKSWLGSSLSFGLAFALAILELLVAALQAYIFTMLSALYFGMANEESH